MSTMSKSYEHEKAVQAVAAVDRDLSHLETLLDASLLLRRGLGHITAEPSVIKAIGQADQLRSTLKQAELDLIDTLERNRVRVQETA